LSLQTTKIISQSEDALVTLEELSQNLPMYVSDIRSIDVPSSLRKMVTQLTEAWHAGYREKSVDGIFEFTINGRYLKFSGPSFNFFELLSVIQKEISYLGSVQNNFSQLVNEGGIGHIRSLIEKSTLQTDYKDQLESPPVNIRIDVGRGSKGAILYLNNIEKDIYYQSWPRNP
jgi:hypothetical protein